MTKKPPMAKAIREFISKMELPPPPTKGPNPHGDYVSIVTAMLLHCRSIEEDATSVICDPSRQQIADVSRRSLSTVKRILARLEDAGVLTVKRRGNRVSNVYTIHKVMAQQLTHQENASDGSTQGFDGSTHPRVMAQLAVPDGSTRVSDGSTVDPLWCKASGSNTPLDKTSLGESLGASPTPKVSDWKETVDPTVWKELVWNITKARKIHIGVWTPHGVIDGREPGRLTCKFPTGTTVELPCPPDPLKDGDPIWEEIAGKILAEAGEGVTC